MMSHPQRRQRRCQAAQVRQGQGQQQGRQQEHRVFGGQQLPARDRQEAITRQAALAIQSEQRLRARRERQHDGDRHGQERLGRQQSRCTPGESGRAQHQRGVEIESRERLPQVLADQLIQRARKMRQAAPHAFRRAGERRRHEPDGEDRGGQGAQAQRHVLPQCQGREEPGDRIEPRAQDPQQPAFAFGERPDGQPLGRDGAQRVGAQRNEEDQPDDEIERREHSRIFEEEEHHADHKKIVPGE